MSSRPETDARLARYRQTLLEMHEHRVENRGSPRRWNRLVHRLQRLHLVLREDARGRAGITQMVHDDVPTVRQWAATHALFWDEAVARAELEREAALPSSIFEFEAKLILREYDAGRLNTTWKAK
ncbi:MAG: hypothetical protein J2P15_08360 [Micromonosporaceae bacterium]|nr:hypothetical protein [Micromonosporaceae bacterium]